MESPGNSESHQRTTWPLFSRGQAQDKLRRTHPESSHSLVQPLLSMLLWSSVMMTVVLITIITVIYSKKNVHNNHKMVMAMVELVTTIATQK